jgi:DNA repair photolyase
MPVDIKEILSKNILSEAKGYLDIGFTHSLNPYSGCAFSCKYCYIREMPIQKFKEIPWGDLLQIQTRSPLITRDIDLLITLKEKCEVLVSMTIETDREDMKRIVALYAPGIKLRLKALRELHDAGMSPQASISPVLPFTPDFPKLLKGIVDRIWIDTLTIGDGSMGKRSERLGMPRLFEAQGVSKWYQKDIHVRVEKCFKKSFPDEMIHVSKNEAFPINKM